MPDVVRGRVAAEALGLSESARYLGFLMCDPTRLAFVFRPPAALVHEENYSVHDAVSERLEAEREEAARPVGDQLPASGERVEIGRDHGRIEQGLAIVQNERRDLAERVLPKELRVRLPGVRGDNGDPVAEPQMGNRHKDFPGEG